MSFFRYLKTVTYYLQTAGLERLVFLSNDMILKRLKFAVLVCLCAIQVMSTLRLA